MLTPDLFMDRLMNWSDIHAQYTRVRKIDFRIYKATGMVLNVLIDAAAEFQGAMHHTKELTVHGEVDMDVYTRLGEIKKLFPNLEKLHVRGSVVLNWKKDFIRPVLGPVFGPPRLLENLKDLRLDIVPRPVAGDMKEVRREISDMFGHHGYSSLRKLALDTSLEPDSANDPLATVLVGHKVELYTFNARFPDDVALSNYGYTDTGGRYDDGTVYGDDGDESYEYGDDEP
jgi:hypothetical protein